MGTTSPMSSVTGSKVSAGVAAAGGAAGAGGAEGAGSADAAALSGPPHAADSSVPTESARKRQPLARIEVRALVVWVMCARFRSIRVGNSAVPLKSTQ